MEQAVLLNIVAINELLKESILNLDINNSSESESEINELLYTMQFSRSRKYKNKIVRIEGYVNNVVPRFTTHQFKEHFRMTPNCFQLLEDKVSLILSKPKKGRPVISPRVQLLATLWLLATPDSYR